MYHIVKKISSILSKITESMELTLYFNIIFSGIIFSSSSLSYSSAFKTNEACIVNYIRHPSSRSHSIVVVLNINLNDSFTTTLAAV